MQVVAPSTVESDRSYTTRLQKGGALLNDMRLLVRTWNGGPLNEQREAGILENVLGKQSRARAADTYGRAFIPRFIRGNPPEAWRIGRALEDREVSSNTIRPIYYWITARSEPLLYDYVTEELMFRSRRADRTIRVDETASWIRAKLAEREKAWSPTVTLKVARGMLATLRDFHILEGAAKKHIAPIYLPIEAFAYLAFALHKCGASGEGLVRHPDWGLFLLATGAVEQLFLEAHQSRLLSYQSAGRIVRIEFAASTFEEMADVVAARAH
jgi:Putative inner membrane protein (DUF1819)